MANSPMELNTARMQGLGPSEDEVVEVSFLLPGWYAVALESVAHSQGLTTGQVVRHLIQSYIEKKE